MEASDLGVFTTDFGIVIDDISKMNFDEAWNGEVSQNYKASLDELLVAANKCLNDLNDYNSVLIKKDEYLKLEEKIKELEKSRDGCDLDTKEGYIQSQIYQDQINQLKIIQYKLSQEILSILSKIISSGDFDVNSVNYETNGEFNYIFDIVDLEKMINDCHRFTGNNMADLFKGVQDNGLSGMDYVNSMLNSVTDNYSGREAAVNSFLMALYLPATQGYKLRYIHEYSNLVSVPYNTNEQLVRGMDCCEIVSWSINKGTAKPFHWEGCGGFDEMEDDYIDISETLPGDILNRYNDSGGGHVVMVIENNLETSMITIAEEYGFGVGGRIRTAPYSEYDNFKAISLEDYYNGDKSNE